MTGEYVTNSIGARKEFCNHIGLKKLKKLGLFLVCMNICAFTCFIISNLLEFSVQSLHLMDDPLIDMDSYCSDPVNVSAAGSSVMIVMYDSRSPCQRPVDYHQLSAKINAHYARLHGYGFLYLNTPCQKLTTYPNSVNSKTCTPCSHPVHGPRASPWCKLPAINYTMHAYRDVEYIVFIDSDAVFYTQSVPVDWVYERRLEQVDTPVLALFNNYPWRLFSSRGHELGCSGIMFWRNTERARSFLQEWWDFDCMSVWNREHPYEQQCLHELIEAREYDMDNSLMQVLDISAFPSTENTKSAQFMLHINPPNWKRVLGFDSGDVIGYRSRLWRMWKIWLHTTSDTLRLNNYSQTCAVNCGVF
jgi:hypothetical protein